MPKNPSNPPHGETALPDQRRYVAMSLNDRSPTGWAVIESATGAIALSAAGKLIFRLSRQEAERRAARLSAGSQADREP